MQGLRAVRAKFPKKKDALLDAVMTCTKLSSAGAKAAKAPGVGCLPLVMWRTGGYDASMELILTKLFRGRGDHVDEGAVSSAVAVWASSLFFFAGCARAAGDHATSATTSNRPAAAADCERPIPASAGASTSTAV